MNGAPSKVGNGCKGRNCYKGRNGKSVDIALQNYASIIWEG